MCVAGVAYPRGRRTAPGTGTTRSPPGSTDRIASGARPAGRSPDLAYHDTALSMPDEPMKVECTACSFTKIVRPDDDQQPSEVVIAHGRNTGHGLEVAPYDGEPDRTRR